MTCHDQIEGYLRGHKIPFGVHRYVFDHAEPAAAKGSHFAGQLHVLSAVVIANNTPVLLVFPKSREIDLPRASKLLSDPTVRLARADELAKIVPGCAADAIPPLGGLYDLPVYADRTLTGDQVIFFPDGSHEAMFSIGYGYFKQLSSPTIAEFTHPVRESPIRSDMESMGGL
jgi:prolyl-tRNA editing enzyme YbaK/EbsC (Cys-tRNA(Pro) deacylase)